MDNKKAMLGKHQCGVHLTWQSNPVYWEFASLKLGICKLVVRYEPQHFVARYVGVRTPPPTYFDGALIVEHTDRPKKPKV
jgi:hypothetical protein